ncbi:SET domain-containing protein-lysine N-methyltransferase [Paraburkholderia sacchari]
MTVSERQLPHIIVRPSPRGRGVFARHALRAGERLIEYKGERTDWDTAFSRLLAGEWHPGSAFLLGLRDGHVMVGTWERNPARWINHSCEPNCEVEVHNSRAFICTRGPIAAAKELTIDYALAADMAPNHEVFKMFVCNCGATACRPTIP